MASINYLSQAITGIKKTFNSSGEKDKTKLSHNNEEVFNGYQPEDSLALTKESGAMPQSGFDIAKMDNPFTKGLEFNSDITPQSFVLTSPDGGMVLENPEMELFSNPFAGIS